MGIGELLDAVKEHLEEPAADGGAEVDEYLSDEEAAALEVETRPRELRLAIVGRPNVGKSSLLNGLLGRERVIVSPLAGTTRDSIDTVLELSLIHISEPTRLLSISYAVFC